MSDDVSIVEETDKEASRLKEKLKDIEASKVNNVISMMSKGLSEIGFDQQEFLFEREDKNTIIFTLDTQKATKLEVGTFTAPGESTIKEKEQPLKITKLINSIKSKRIVSRIEKTGNNIITIVL